VSLRTWSPDLSVVVPALNETPHLYHTVTRLQETLPARSEILVVDDGSTDGCADFLQTTTEASLTLLHTAHLGAAQARNWGAQHARGKILVFADAHISTPSGWWEPLVAALDNPRVGAVAPVISTMGQPQRKGFGLRWQGPSLEVEWLIPQGQTRYPVPLLPGACLAMRADTWQVTGGFDAGIQRWGAEDTELSLRLWLLGYELYLVPEVDVAHVFRQRHPYAITWTAVLHNLLRVAFVHFHPARLRRVVVALKNHAAFAAALALIGQSDIWKRRAEFRLRRVRDDEWFVQRFGLTL
jgi:GT2 family glycosyltransferase